MALHKYLPVWLIMFKKAGLSHSANTPQYSGFYFLFQNHTSIWKDFLTCSHSANGQEYYNCTASFSHSTHFCQIYSAHEKFQQQSSGLQLTVKPEFRFLNAPCRQSGIHPNSYSTFFEQHAKVWKFPKLTNKQSCQQTWAFRSYIIRFLHGPPRLPYRGITTKQNKSFFFPKCSAFIGTESTHHTGEKKDLLAYCICPGLFMS